MGKAKKVVTVEGPARAETPEQPKAAVPAGDLDDMMSGMAVATKPVKKGKKEVEDVTIADPGVKQLLVALLRATAREKAAKAKQEGLKKQLRPVFDTEYFKLSHQMQSFLKTVCINDQCNYSAPNVGVAAIQGSTPAELKQALAAMKEKLVKLLGQERYAKHIKSTSTLVVNTTPENMALLRTKLTAEEFVQFFTYIPGLDLTTEKEGSDSIVCLKRDMSIDPAVEALVRQGVKEGLLTLTEGAVAPQKSALAVVEQEILKEQKAADEAVAAKTAGQVAGAVTGAVVEAAVATAVKL